MKKDSIQTRKRKPKGQGKGKKQANGKRELSAVDSPVHNGFQQPSLQTNTKETSPISSSSASSLSLHNASGSSSASSAINYYHHGNSMAGDAVNLSLQYQHNTSIQSQRSLSSGEGLGNNSVLASSGLDQTLGGRSSCSPPAEDDHTTSNLGTSPSGAISNVSTHSSNGLRCSPDSDRYSPSHATAGHLAMYSNNVGLPRMAYPNGYALQASTIPLINSTDASSNYQSYSLTIPGRQQSDGTAMPSSSANFHSAASFIDQPMIDPSGYRGLVATTGYHDSGPLYPASNSACGPTRLYRNTQHHHHPYSRPTYVKNESGLA